jgi:hypothetical protein
MGQNSSLDYILNTFSSKGNNVGQSCNRAAVQGPRTGAARQLCPGCPLHRWQGHRLHSEGGHPSPKSTDPRFPSSVCAALGWLGQAQQSHSGPDSRPLRARLVFCPCVPVSLLFLSVRASSPHRPRPLPFLANVLLARAVLPLPADPLGWGTQPLQER